MTAVVAPENYSTDAQNVPVWLKSLRSAKAVRERAKLVYRFITEGRSAHFLLDEGMMSDVAAYVARICREQYPDLAIPLHSRWRHFEVGGIDRWSSIATQITGVRERARAAIDLATVSVLLDAGAGSDWHYLEESTGCIYARSEGLAVASLEMFRAGCFSSDRSQPFRVDAAALSPIRAEVLGRLFQVRDDNPLLGLDQRALLLRRLGQALAAQPVLFGGAGRPGALLDASILRSGTVSLPTILTLLLEALGSVWPSALVVDDQPVGDSAPHPAVITGDKTNGIVPFHKLSQWLTYSLVEPLQWAGLTVTDIDGLTGLPEYRNGGLFVDLGVIKLRNKSDREIVHHLDSLVVCEWRALTVMLLDRLLPLMRKELGRCDDFLLPNMLQGGTWSAGRRIAAELRPPTGSSPISVESDGTVF